MTSPYSGIQIISENEVPIPRISYKKFSLSFKYPTLCDATTCKPLEIKLQPGNYQLECWGAKGTIFSNSGQPGLGAYTSGIITLKEERTVYIAIGATGYYNAINGIAINPTGAPEGGGGATDVRLSITSNWYDIKSLATRIMVAAGGGSAEFNNAIAGHGGTLEGGQSEYQGTKCPGATQTRSQSCPNIEDHNAVPGNFGTAGFPTPTNDHGGFGGSGYYGGTSYTWAYAGSGGSSFISGHEGCKAIEDPGSGTTITHKEDSIHYSGLYFNKTQMIAGNEEMPLPDGSHGIWSESNGAFRITYLLYTPYTCMKRKNIISLLFICDALSILQLS